MTIIQASKSPKRDERMNLLQIDSSLLGAHSASRELTRAIVQAWRTAEPDMQVKYRDLAATVPPQLTGEAVKTLKFGQPTPQGDVAADLRFMEELLVEFLETDAIVIGAPMYNFSLPSQLKSWLDALAQPGRTFAYASDGPRGLAGGKRAIIASSRGGVYSNSKMSAKDFQETYLTAMLNFMGVTKVEIVRAEGLSLGKDQRDAALRQAHQRIETLFVPDGVTA
jgi:FMN-dependent NADH-azoreductase